MLMKVEWLVTSLTVAYSGGQAFLCSAATLLLTYPHGKF